MRLAETYRRWRERDGVDRAKAWRELGVGDKDAARYEAGDRLPATVVAAIRLYGYVRLTAGIPIGGVR